MRTLAIWLAILLIAFVAACSLKGASRLTHGMGSSALPTAPVAVQTGIVEGRPMAPELQGISTQEYIANLDSGDGISDGDFTLFVLDAQYYPIFDLSKRLSLQVQSNEKTTVGIYGSDDLEALDLYLYLRYQQNSYAPLSVEPADFLGLAEKDFIFFACLDVPGFIPIGFSRLDRTGLVYGV